MSDRTNVEEPQAPETGISGAEHISGRWADVPDCGPRLTEEMIPDLPQQWRLFATVSLKFWSQSTTVEDRMTSALLAELAIHRRALDRSRWLSNQYLHQLNRIDGGDRLACDDLDQWIERMLALRIH